MKNIVVRVFEKNSERLEKIETFENQLTIGRAWDSDLILQDKFVDPSHIRVTAKEDGNLEILDLGSLNGTRIGKQTIKNGSIDYRFGEPIVIGDTKLVFYDHLESVPPAANRSLWFLAAEKFNTLPKLIGLTLVALAVTFLAGFLFDSEPLDSRKALIDLIGLGVLVAMWTVFFGMISKLLRGETNFKLLFILACFGIIFLELARIFVEIIRFNIQNYDAGQIMWQIVFIAIGIIVLTGVLTFTTYFSSKKKWVISTLIAVAIFGSVRGEYFLREEHEKWQDFTSIEDAILPPAMLFNRGVDIESYQNKTLELFNFSPEELEDES